MLILGAAIAWYAKPEKVKTKTVTEVQERVRVDTRIVERPDGTKETVITETRDSDLRTSQEKLVLSPSRDWSVGLGVEFPNLQPEYMVQVQRRIALDLYAGLYYRTDDNAVGAIVSYSF